LKRILAIWDELNLFIQALIVITVLGSFGGVVYMVKPGWFAWFTSPKGVASQTAEGVQLPSFQGKAEALPTAKPVFTPDQVAAEGAGLIRHISIGWNANIGLIYANRGATTQPGSLMDQYGLRAQISRNDDYGVLSTQLVQFARSYAEGTADPSIGANMITVMSDGSPAVLVGIQSQLDDIVADVKKTKGRDIKLTATIIGAPGRSLGEDKCIGPFQWLDNPKSAIGIQTDPVTGEKYGAAIPGVPRDGDIHLCLDWAQMNGLKVNTDVNTFDPDALNFFHVNMYTDADQLFISGACAQRDIVRDGKRTGEKIKVCPVGSATWFPGDDNIVNKKGGVVSLLSTRENAAQMFASIIVIKEWAEENPATVTNYLKAALDGSALVSNDRAKLRQAANWSARVWGEKDGAWWEKAYYGYEIVAPGTGGRKITLGGSDAVGLATNLEYFLPQGGSPSIFKRVFDQYCQRDKRLYPTEMPNCPTGDPVTSSFLERIRDSVGAGNVGEGRVVGEVFGDENQTVGMRPYQIQFRVGSAELLPSSERDLDEILEQMLRGSNMTVQVDGYTSSDGDPTSNQRLSEARAKAVYDYLKRKAPPGYVTPTRVRTAGYGSEDPVASNDTEEGRRLNRRVVVSFYRR
jgi:OOP family OmpA-OmpF porin